MSKGGGVMSMDDIHEPFTEEELLRIANSCAKHNMGTNQLIEIAEASGRLGDSGIYMNKILRHIEEKYNQDSYLDIRVNEGKHNPLLTIELQDESSVPKVFYQGEEITKKINVHFDWDTDTEMPGGLSYGFEHMKSDGAVEVIERRTKEHR